jgi:hypothetical protein
MKTFFLSVCLVACFLTGVYIENHDVVDLESLFQLIDP